MEDFDVNIDHATHSVGGGYGHLLRRLTHVSMCVIPLLYYMFGEQISGYLDVTPTQFVSLVCISILSLEALRLKFGIVVIGQREYESNQVSALAWGTFAVSVALLASPTMGREGVESGVFGIPIILGLCIVDPVMGETKRRTEGLSTAVRIGLLTSYAVWLTCCFLLDTPVAAAIILAPMTVLGELPRTNLIDDNATMVFFPLSVLILIYPWM